MAATKEQIKNLRKVIEFRWRVQSAIPKNAPTHCQMIAYIDARQAQQHLDDIVGPENWCTKYESIKNVMYCSVGINTENGWVFKSDAGTETMVEKSKGEASDAFKRACVAWGINRDAYNVGIVKLDAKPYGKAFYPCDKNGRFLKGEELNKVCNSLAKVEELENYELDLTTDKIDSVIASRVEEDRRITAFIEKASSEYQLSQVEQFLTNDLQKELYDKKKSELKL